MEYVAFLRGINVGGRKPVKMEVLRRAFEALGFQEVKTVLASGNVLFKSTKEGEVSLVEKIEEKLQQVFRSSIGVILRTAEEIEALVEENPFGNIPSTSATRFYVTFLSEKTKSTLSIPYESPEEDFRIISASPKEVCSMLVLSPGRQTPGVMSFLEKEFGKKITTRNWNTVLKLVRKPSRD